MIDAPSSTWFTIAPHWRWYIVVYFFLGGLAGGCYFLGALIDLFGRREDRPLARLGYYIAFPLVNICGILLILDLSRPLRFWHMLVERNTFEPMFKSWSPMSFGSWGLTAFGFFSFLSFLAALADEKPLGRPWRWLQWPALSALRAPALLGYPIAVLGGISGFFLAGYTGILLAVTNRPIWADTPLLGMLFLISAASTAAALLVLLGHHWGWRMAGLRDLHRMDDWVIALELLVLIAVVISLGPVLAAWMNAWGALLLLTVVVGMLVPLWMSWRARTRGTRHPAMAATLVLIGGFLLRVVIVLSSEAV